MSLAREMIATIAAEIASDPILAETLAVALAPHLPTPEQDGGWLDTRDAAAYLGLPSVDQLHKLTSERRLPFSQERPGSKCYFRRADLDAHRDRYLRGGQA